MAVSALAGVFKLVPSLQRAWARCFSATGSICLVSSEDVAGVNGARQPISAI